MYFMFIFYRLPFRRVINDDDYHLIAIGTVYRSEDD